MDQLRSAELLRDILPSEYSEAFWSRGLRSDGRGFLAQRPLSISVTGTQGFGGQLGGNVAEASFGWVKSAGEWRLGAAPRARKLALVGDSLRQFEPRAQAALEAVASALEEHFGEVLAKVEGSFLEVRLSFLLDDGNSTLLAAVLAQACVLAALAGRVAEISMHPVEFFVLRAFPRTQSPQALLLSDPSSEEKRLGISPSPGEFLLARRNGALLVKTLQAPPPGLLRPLELLQIAGSLSSDQTPAVKKAVEDLLAAIEKQTRSN